MSHLTNEQRHTIFVMKQQGFKNNQIANIIDKDKSVISRELKRNCDKRSEQYRAELAHNLLYSSFLSILNKTIQNKRYFITQLI